MHRIGRTGRAGREGIAITLVEPREHRLLRNIEHFTKQKIEIATVPTVADLRARRLELTRGALEEALLEGEESLETYRVVVNSLAAEYDVVDIAAAAVKLAEENRRDGETVDEQEIPAVPVRERPRERKDGRSGRGDRAERDSGRERERPARLGREARGGRGGRRSRGSQSEFDVTRVYIGAGRKAGIRPGDLVGAIANEAQVDSRSIGAIEIADRFSLVEVPEDMAEQIIDALRSTTLKGKRVMVRRDRDFESGGRD